MKECDNSKIHISSNFISSICVVLCIVCVDCVVLCIVCVYMCTVLLPPGGNPIAVKYIIPYIISYHHISYINHIISYVYMSSLNVMEETASKE